MTDNQLLDVILNRVNKLIEINGHHPKNSKVVITQQYGKKLFFAVLVSTNKMPYWFRFTKDGISKVFIMPELPERLMEWKRATIKKIQANCLNYIDFDLESTPKEVIHIFFSAFISALNIPGMSIGLMNVGIPEIFEPNETYEEVQIKADMMMFE